jgi:hypothetical protein
VLQAALEPIDPDQRERLTVLLPRGWRRALARLMWEPRRYDWFEGRLREDLAAGEVQRLEVEVQRLAVGEELASEGPLLFCCTGDGHVLCLAGGWLDDPTIVTGPQLSAGTFYRRFRCLRAPRVGVVFGLEAGHGTIAAERTVAAQAIPFFGESLLLETDLHGIEEALRASVPDPRS